MITGGGDKSNYNRALQPRAAGSEACRFAVVDNRQGGARSRISRDA
jgi:hypothetical protein